MGGRLLHHTRTLEYIGWAILGIHPTNSPQTYNVDSREGVSEIQQNVSRTKVENVNGDTTLLTDTAYK